ncbi:hypothetical protein [Laceyella putida]|uniref:DUF4158 domain-containing protein n=1 Tax=Laceyella putida TaxID=110101 RepID=A0ABW2RMQ9_9BACL
MKRNWNHDELLKHFGLVPVEKQLIGNKTGASRLGFTVLLKYFQQEARFPINAGATDVIRTYRPLLEALGVDLLEGEEISAK